MENWKYLIFFSIFINLSIQNPLDLEETSFKTRPHVEEKNWKIKTGFYNDKTLKNQFMDDPPATYRLPNDTLPIRYDIFLKTDVDKGNFDFDGRVIIHIRVVESTNVVTLQYRDITLISVSLKEVTSDKVLAVLNFTYIESHEFVKIELPETFNVDQEFRLDISYNGTLKTNDAGFYRAYYTEGDEIIYYAVTQFESTDARHAFPCYDEPAIRTPIGLQIQHNKNYSAYSNMPLTDVFPFINDYIISKFNDTPPMQTYLLAFLVSPFKSVSNNDLEIPQRILAKPSSIENGEAEFAVNIADDILKKFVNHFGVNYTLPQLDHAAITQFSAGAMENWGLITYREKYLLLAPNSSQSESLKRGIIATMAHEDAHQFFGNLVAPHWWSDLWMNEGFATLYEYYIPHLLYPDDGWMEEFRVWEINWCFGYDILSSSRVPMHYYVETSRDIDNRFNSVSYSKSGVVLNMFQEALSVSTFTKGLRKYLTKMSFKAARPKDLFASLQEAYDEDNSNNSVNVESIMSSWVYQAGYPLVNVSRSENKLIFTQKRYPDSAGEIYSIPLSFATQRNPDFGQKTAKIWMTTETLEIEQKSIGMGDNDWIVFNIQQTGYYRLAYSSELWHAISNGLKQNHTQIHSINRIVLLDELNLDYTENINNLSPTTVLNVLSYLTDEEEYRAWPFAASLIRLLDKKLFGTSAYESFNNFVISITKKQLNRIGLESTENEAGAYRSLRNNIKPLSCYALDEDCLNHEHQKLLKYKENEKDNPVPDFCSAFRKSNSLNYVYYLFEVADNLDVLNRRSIISGLGCSLSESLLELTALVVEDKTKVFTTDERVSIINTMMSRSILGLEEALSFLERNPDKIIEHIANFISIINSEKYANKLIKILDAAFAGDFISESQVQRIKNAIKQNLKWQDDYLEEIDEFFENFNNGRTTERSTTQYVETTTPASASGVVISSLVFTVMVFIKILN